MADSFSKRNARDFFWIVNIIVRHFGSKHREYALSAPFTERFFSLAAESGFVGMINASSFTKREFGVSLIESVLPNVELSKILDTSGAYIPGHGTPTL